MGVMVCILEHSRAPVDVRELLSFTTHEVRRIVRTVLKHSPVEGCVLLSTCNRTELYVWGTGECSPAQLLCQACGEDYGAFAPYFQELEDQFAVEHLIQVACGLRSRVFREDQILTQVKQAIGLAREEKTANPQLETIFRTAISAGKEVRSKVKTDHMPASVAHQAVQSLLQIWKGGEGRRVLVIGNGEMGRLCAGLLYERGCHVTITLRSYRHGQTVVPRGCHTVAYDDRYLAMEGMDAVVSVTASPHHTVELAAFEQVQHPPGIFIDLAIPRDIDPEMGQLDTVKLMNLDQFGDPAQWRQIPEAVQAVTARWYQAYDRWLHYRDTMPATQELKQAVLDRVLTDQRLVGEDDPVKIAEVAVSKTIALLSHGLAQSVSSDQIARCSRNIRIRTKAKAVLQVRKGQ